MELYVNTLHPRESEVKKEGSAPNDDFDDDADVAALLTDVDRSSLTDDRLNVTSSSGDLRHDSPDASNATDVTESISWDISEQFPPLTEVSRNFTGKMKRGEQSDTEIRKLRLALTHSCAALAEGHRPEQLDVPVDLLLDFCDVYGDSVWNWNTIAVSTVIDLIDGEEELVGRPSKLRAFNEPRWSVDLFGKDKSQINSVRSLLLTCGTHWPDISHSEIDVGGGTGVDELQVVNILRVEDARRVWAYLGNNFEEWLASLNDWLQRHGPARLLDDEPFLTCPPKTKDVLLLKINDENCPRLYSLGIKFARAEVRRSTDAGIDLFLVDYAMATRQQLESLVPLNEKSNLARIPSIAQRFQIEGVVAKPDVGIVSLSVDFLSQAIGLGHWKFYVNDCTLQRLFEAVENLCLVDVRELRTRALACVAAIPMEFDVDQHHSPKGFFAVADLFLKTVLKLIEPETSILSADIEEVALMTSAVKNLAFDSCRIRRYFAESEGVAILMMSIHSGKFCSPVVMELWKLIRVVFGPRPDFENTRQYLKQPRRKDVDVILPKKPVRHLLRRNRCWIENDLVDVIDSSEGSFGSDPSYVLARAPVAKEWLMQGDILSIESFGCPVLLLGIKEYTPPALVALLNSGLGGVMFIGVDSDLSVQGVEMTSKERDIMRLKYDQQLPCKLSPRPASNMFLLSFVRVVRTEQPVLPTDDSSPLLTLYVIRVDVSKPRSDCLFTLGDGGECFLYVRGQVAKFSAHQMREMFIRQMINSKKGVSFSKIAAPSF